MFISRTYSKPIRRKRNKDNMWGFDVDYYKRITIVLNEDLLHRKFNYSSILGLHYYRYNRTPRKSHLEKYVKFLKKWKFVEYNQGGNTPFSMIRPIPQSLVYTVCVNKWMTDEEREKIVQEHYKMMRKEKIEKIKSKIQL